LVKKNTKAREKNSLKLVNKWMINDELNGLNWKKKKGLKVHV
jgi:hypothetical protein